MITPGLPDYIFFQFKKKLGYELHYSSLPHAHVNHQASLGHLNWDTDSMSRKYTPVL